MSFVVGTGRPAEVLLAEAVGADPLVVGSRARRVLRSGRGSVTQKLLAHASRPVAVLHAGVPLRPRPE